MQELSLLPPGVRISENWSQEPEPCTGPRNPLGDPTVLTPRSNATPAVFVKALSGNNLWWTNEAAVQIQLWSRRCLPLPTGGASESQELGPRAEFVNVFACRVAGGHT